MVKNLPANAEDTGSIPGPGGSHMSWSNNYAHALLGLNLTPGATTSKATAMRSLCTPAREQPPLSTTRESLYTATKTKTAKNK